MSDSNRLGGLKARPKDTSAAAVGRAVEVGERLGFVDRSPRRKPGRRPGPETAQLHPRIRLEIADAIADEAADRGMTHGQFVEFLWKSWTETG